MKDRFFEKVSFEEFKKTIKNDKELYNSYLLPSRKTKYSAGYDLISILDYSIEPGERLLIPTGYKAKYLDDEMLMIVVRSSVGVKYNVRLSNQVGIIDSDYYNNPSNEGHIFVSLANEGNETFYIKKGTAYAQGIFVKYLTCDDTVIPDRVGGFGSTNRKEEEK